MLSRNHRIAVVAALLTLPIVACAAPSEPSSEELTITAADIYFPEEMLIDLSETGPVTFDSSDGPVPFDRVTLTGLRDGDVRIGLEDWMADRRRETGVDVAESGRFTIDPRDLQNAPVVSAATGARYLIWLQTCWDCTEEAFCQPSPDDVNALICTTVTICYGYYSTFCG